MVDMTQTRDLRKARATETELAIEQIAKAVMKISENQVRIMKDLVKLMEVVKDYREEEIDTLYGLFPELDVINIVAENEDDRKELLRQYGNGRKILETEHTYLDTEAAYDNTTE